MYWFPADPLLQGSSRIDDKLLYNPDGESVLCVSHVVLIGGLEKYNWASWALKAKYANIFGAEVVKELCGMPISERHAALEAASLPETSDNVLEDHKSSLMNMVPSLEKSAMAAYALQPVEDDDDEESGNKSGSKRESKDSDPELSNSYQQKDTSTGPLDAPADVAMEEEEVVPEEQVGVGTVGSPQAGEKRKKRAFSNASNASTKSTRAPPRSRAATANPRSPSAMPEHESSMPVVPDQPENAGINGDALMEEILAAADKLTASTYNENHTRNEVPSGQDGGGQHADDAAGMSPLAASASSDIDFKEVLASDVQLY
ncbi:hypothetical protein FOMPIDRAFT_1021027, partial [Fomitopsis schrenkii]